MPEAKNTERQEIPRFSHGEDGFWQDPEGLYVEFSDHRASLEEAAADQELVAGARTINRKYHEARTEASLEGEARRRAEVQRDEARQERDTAKVDLLHLSRGYEAQRAGLEQVKAALGSERTAADVGAARVALEALTLTEQECISCGEGNPKGECPKSKRLCGHHCNCSWIHDRCCWCSKEFGAVDAPQESTEHDYLSTACLHDLHDRCRRTCKFCEVLCRCSCHGTGKAPQEPPNEEPLPPCSCGGSGERHAPGCQA